MKISVKIYKVYTNSDIQIIRFYGEKSELLIDRQVEKKIMDYLNNIAPKILIDYDNCRIEEYFEGVNNIHPSKYQKMSLENICFLLLILVIQMLL